MKEKSSRRLRYRGVVPEEPFEIGEEEARKIRDVLRLGPGAEVFLLDDTGRIHNCTVAEISKQRCVIQPTGSARAGVHGKPLTVGAGIIKGKHMEWMIEKLGELGVESVLPIATDRSVIESPGANKIERWRKIATAAALQSGHAHETRILDPAASVESAVAEYDSVVFLDFEEGPASSRPSSADLLLIGPEGGWSDSERTFLKSAATPYSLGPATLRTETAAIIGAYALSGPTPAP